MPGAHRAARTLDPTSLLRYSGPVPDLDTRPEAAAVRLRWLRSRTMDERLRMTIQLSEDVREISRCGIRARHPDYSDQEVEWAPRRLILGDELFHAAWPAAPRLPA